MNQKTNKSEQIEQKKELQCEWCGKPAVVWYDYEMLCENCWKYYTSQQNKENEKQNR